MTKSNSKAREAAHIGLMIALLEASKLALNHIPNVELVSFLIIMFTLYFGRKTFVAIPVFILIEVMIFGFEPMWVIAYCYIWPFLCLLTLVFKSFRSAFSMSLLSGFFGLFFGFLCSFPYLFVTTALNPNASFVSAVAWWITGIPYDVLHGISNFIIMLVLYKPVSKVLDRAVKKQGAE